MLNFEDSMNAYLRDYVPPPWTPSNPGSLLYHVVFGANDLEAMQLLILKAAERNAAWVYVTSLGASNGNPYQRLPSYFSQEVDFVNSIDGMHAPLARWEAAFLIITPLVVLVILSVDMIERRKK